MSRMGLAKSTDALAKNQHLADDGAEQKEGPNRSSRALGTHAKLALENEPFPYQISLVPFHTVEGPRSCGISRLSDVAGECLTLPGRRVMITLDS